MAPYILGLRYLPAEQTQRRGNMELNKKNLSRKKEDTFRLKTEKGEIKRRDAKYIFQKLAW